MKKAHLPNRLAYPLILSLLPGVSLGAGFQLAERSAAGLGRAFSGEAAIADDASILGSNPAGMSLLDDMSFAIGSSYILPNVDASGNTPFGPASDKNIISDAVVPYSYFAMKVNDQVSVGFGVYTTFGLKSNYDRQFATRAITDHSEVLTVNFNPAISYRINDQWTVGVGFDALYADGQIRSRTPGVGTRLFDLTGDDWGFGYNVGLLYEINEGTRIGLHYRSSVELSLEGEAELGTGFAPFPAGTYNAGLDVELPDTFEISIYHELNDRWAVHADVLWTNWSKFESLDPQVNPLIDERLSTAENWNDAFRFSIGATYQYNDRLTLRGGVAYDQSPVDTQDRTLRIPDADRVWASIGASYKLNNNFSVDIGYTHLFTDTADILRKANGGNEDTFQGQANGDVDVFSIGLSGSF